ncbi:MAG: 3-deoxy-D-manno-octulosonic acid transferase [Fimbriimonadales bacterium]
MRGLYNLALLLGTPLWLGYVLVRVLGGSWRERWWERFGWVPVPPPKDKRRIWLHCVSVGETVAALPLIKQIRATLPDYELILSTTTPTGQQTAWSQARDYVDYLIYFPLDLPFAVRRAIRRIQPSLLILFETELWLNLLAEQHRQGGAVMVVNGRLSDRSFQRAKRFRWLFQKMLGYVDFVCAQSPTDAGRFVELGMSPSRVEMTGNTKFDQALESLSAPEAWREILSLPPEAPVIVVGSTRTPEEEQIVVEAYLKVRARLPETCLVIAPRHLERVPEVESLLQSHQLNPFRRSQLPLAPNADAPPYAQVVIVDSFGELARLYAVADVAVVGGAFAPLGGQNLFQPLAHGKPVFFGPHTHNFRDIAQLAQSAGIGFEVSTAEELANGIIRLLESPKEREAIAERARQLIQQHHGATQRCLQFIQRWVQHHEKHTLSVFKRL